MPVPFWIISNLWQKKKKGKFSEKLTNMIVSVLMYSYYFFGCNPSAFDSVHRISSLEVPYSFQ